MPTCLRSALPLLRGADCFSADAVESLGNCSLQCHYRPTYFLEPHIDFRQADNIHPRPIVVQLSPASEGCGMRLESVDLPINAQSGHIGIHSTNRRSDDPTYRDLS